MEKVLVFDASVVNLFSDILAEDKISFEEKDLDILFKDILQDKNKFKFIDRDKAEKDESVKQIIPYVVVNDPRKDNVILAYSRSKKSGEKRLHNKWSIGIGGHVNPIDDTEDKIPMQIVAAAASRELSEELEWGKSKLECDFFPVAIIYDDSNEVGRVHFGVVFAFELKGDTEQPTLKEDTINELNWLQIDEMGDLNLENWSSLIVNSYTGGDDADSES